MASPHIGKISMKIDLYTDIVCPWCLIGQHRLDSILSTRFRDLRVDIEHHPVILIPDCPPHGIKIADLMSSRGIDQTAMRIRTEGEARKTGIALELDRQPFLFPSVEGHTLIRMARRRGTQHALALALSVANFEGRNIADREVLADIASSHGFTKNEIDQIIRWDAELEVTRAAAAVSAAKGVRSVPHFVFDGSVALNGHQSEDAFVEGIQSVARIGNASAKVKAN